MKVNDNCSASKESQHLPDTSEYHRIIMVQDPADKICVSDHPARFLRNFLYELIESQLAILTSHVLYVPYISFMFCICSVLHLFIL